MSGRPSGLSDTADLKSALLLSDSETRRRVLRGPEGAVSPVPQPRVALTCRRRSDIGAHAETLRNHPIARRVKPPVRLPIPPLNGDAILRRPDSARMLNPPFKED